VINPKKIFVYHFCLFVLHGFAPNSWAQAKTYGLLYLDVKPADSQVSLDDRILDKGVWLLSLAPGYHQIRIVNEGYQVYENEIEIQSSLSSHLNIQLVLTEQYSITDPKWDPKFGGK